jgi:hypothetical protein
LEKQRTDIEMTELAAKLQKSEAARKMSEYLSERAHVDMSKAESERDVALRIVQTAQRELLESRRDLVAIAGERDAASNAALQAKEEVLRKSMQYGLAVHLIRKLKAVKAKFEIAHANVAQKSQALAELFDYIAHGDRAPGRAYPKHLRRIMVFLSFVGESAWLHFQRTMGFPSWKSKQNWQADEMVALGIGPDFFDLEEQHIHRALDIFVETVKRRSGGNPSPLALQVCCSIDAISLTAAVSADLKTGMISGLVQPLTIDADDLVALQDPKVCMIGTREFKQRVRRRNRSELVLAAMLCHGREYGNNFGQFQGISSSSICTIPSGELAIRVAMMNEGEAF